MSSDTSTTPSQASTPTHAIKCTVLRASIEKKSKEEILDEAHGNIKYLEVHVDQARRYVDMLDRLRIHTGHEPDVEQALMLAKQTTAILDLDRTVDKCLFGDHAVDMAITKTLDDGVMDVLNGLGKVLLELTQFLVVARTGTKLPEGSRDEIDALLERMRILHSKHTEDPQHDEVPSLMASYDTSTDDEIKNKARGAIQALEDLFCRAKALALNSLPRLGNHIGFGKPGLLACDVLDIGGDLVVFRRYVNKLVEAKTDTEAVDGRVVTRFMAGKFDRATSRLASRIKAQISTLEKFAVPWVIPPPGLGEEQSWDSVEVIMQILAIHETINSLMLGYMSRLLPEQGKLVNEEVRKGVTFGDLVRYVPELIARMIKIQENLESNHGALVDYLGQDFVHKVLEAIHDFTKVEVSALEQFESKLEKR